MEREFVTRRRTKKTVTRQERQTRSKHGRHTICNLFNPLYNFATIRSIPFRPYPFRSLYGEIHPQPRESRGKKTNTTSNTHTQTFSSIWGQKMVSMHDRFQLFALRSKTVRRDCRETMMITPKRSGGCRTSWRRTNEDGRTFVCSQSISLSLSGSTRPMMALF